MISTGLALAVCGMACWAGNDAMCTFDEFGKCVVAPGPRPAVRLYVAPNGSDANPGTKAKPFASLERARDEIRKLRQASGLPEGGIAVTVAGGHYAVAQSFELGPLDCGTANEPIAYRAARGTKPVFSGGVRLTDFAPVTDPAVLARLPEEARGKVVQVDLKPLGVKDLPPLVMGGFASGNGFLTHPVIELFFNGEAQPMARYPNKGMMRVVDICVDDGHTVIGMKGSKIGRFIYEGDRPARWKDEPNALLYGYWFFGWADSYERIVSIDIEKHEIQLAEPYHNYGYRKDSPFFALNLLSELDAPGEWYLDRAKSVLYLYPPSDPRNANVELSLFAQPMVKTKDASHVRFEGLTWELGSGDAILVEGGQQCLFEGCTVRWFGGNGIEIKGGSRHGILSCDIYSLGRGGTVITGGDRKTLKPGGHFVANCDIHHLSRIDHTYTPAVLMNGVGNRVTHNCMHHIDSSAMRVEGNDHLIDYNEVHDVLLESDDQGGADMFGNPTFRGNVYRCNYWHHIGNWDGKKEEVGCGQAGIRLDDAISGVLIEGNIFYRCSSGKLGFGGVQIHGGKENILENNIFADCTAAVSCSAWDTERWNKFVANALDAPEIDAALYKEKYPQLAALTENPNQNLIQRNLVWNCKHFILRDSGKNQLTDNVTLKDEPVFKNAPKGDFRLKPGAQKMLPKGFKPIPVGKIGMYR